MLRISSLKKFVFPVAAALLFVAITGIIIYGKSDIKAVQTSSISEENSPKILIIDPGHGGSDGGAVAPDGSLESDLNLAIARRLESAAKLFGINTLMTRTDESLPYPEAAETLRQKKNWDQNSRMKLINSVPNSVLISIHQNNFSDPRPSGPEVYYGDLPGGLELAESVQKNLTEKLCPQNRRLAAPIFDSIYLIKNANCPAILAECGFISNPGELELLKSMQYQCKLSVILLACYIQFIS